jgi:uncharacterized Ntn-hydrolase superfamily protein
MTFSISARCPRTGLLGIAVSSSSPAVAARCAHARAGVGAVATQNVTDPTLGPKGLELMASGLAAEAALDRIKRSAANIEYRQLAFIDAAGRTAAYSGSKTLGTHGSASGPGAVAAGNLLSRPDVPQRMIEAFAAAAHLDLGDRLITAMRAALAAGGEAGPVKSAGMLLVREVPWPVADLRVDWHDEPVDALAGLWVMWKPQLDDYVTRALDPASAPAYGVAGER